MNTRISMRPYRYLLLSLLLLLGSSMQGWAQIPKPPVGLPSATTASLGRYGETNVSLFTGTPQIDIPIYTISDGAISVPISLSYNASGVRPDQRPGWTGMNWSMNATAAVTRVIKDLNDENVAHNIVYNQPSGPSYGYFFSCSYNLNYDEWSTETTMINMTTGSENRHFMDTEPDEYSFSLPGRYSGKFYLDIFKNDSGVLYVDWRVQADKKCKVLVDLNTRLLDIPFQPLASSPWKEFTNFYDSKDGKKGFLPTLRGFTIIDEDGTKFIFGNDVSAIEYSIGFFSQNKDMWVANAWYLTKIIDPSGREVSFRYNHGEPDTFTSQMYLSIYRRKNKLGDGKSQFFKHLSFTNSSLTLPCESSPALDPPWGIYDGKLIYPVYLEEITSRNEKITFSTSLSNELPYDPAVYQTYHNWRQNNLGQNESLYEYIGYLFNDVYNGTESYSSAIKKLQWRKLDNIQITVPHAFTPIRQFNFTYNNVASERLMLQSFGEMTLNGTESIPPYQFFYDTSKPLPPYLNNQTDHWGFFNGRSAVLDNLQNYYNLKETDAAFLRAGTLSRMVYPTAGYTDFVYEPHTYAKEVGELRHEALQENSQDKTAGGLRIRKIISFDPSRPQEKMEKEYFYIRNYTPGGSLTGRSSGVLGAKAKYHWGEFKTRSVTDPNQIITEEVFSGQSVLPASENSMGSHVGYSEVVEKSSDGSTVVYKFTNFDAHPGLDDGHLDDPFVSTLHRSKSPYQPNNSKALERGKLLAKELYNSSGKPVSKTYYRYKAINKEEETTKAMKANRISTCDPNLYYAGEATSYLIYTYSYKADQEEQYVYDQVDPTKYLLTRTSYTYNNLGQLKEEKQIKSDGTEVYTRIKYPADIYTALSGTTISTDWDAFALEKMEKELYMTGVVVEKQVWEKQPSQTTEKLVTGSLTKFFQFFPGKVFPAQAYSYQAAAPVSNPVVTRVSGGKLQLDLYNPAQNDRQGYERMASFEKYDDKGNLLTFRAKGSPPVSYIWGVNQTLPIAQVTNAKANQIFYTSFEDNLPASNSSSDSKIGGSSCKVAYQVKLPSEGTYTLTYWKKTSATGNWELVSQTISANTTIGGTGILIDEVRLYPVGAQMVTFTYRLLTGITSQTDANNVTTYYEYDRLRRLTTIRDQDKKLVKSFYYHHKQ